MNNSNYNTEQAKNTLINAGWEYKNSRWQKKDQGRTLRLNLTLSVNSSNTSRFAAAQNIKAQ